MKKKYVFAGASYRGSRAFMRPMKKEYSNYCELLGVHDVNIGRAKTIGDELKIPVFENFEEMIKQTKPDIVVVTTVVAQYDFDEYYRFWSMQEEIDGELTDMLENGYEVFNTKSVEEMMAAAYQAFDKRIASYGSTTQDLDQAQAKIMKDNNDAIFMANGDWMLNEVKLNYKNQIQDIEFINFPVVSALGTKLFGTGTSYNLSDEKCEQILTTIIDLVDDNKSLQEIITAVKNNLDIDISEEDAFEVANARGIYYSRGLEFRAYINKNALAKEPAELFLRMMASDDFAKVFSRTANGSTPYSSEKVVSEYKFVNQASDIALNRYAKVYTARPDGLRKDLGLGSIFTSISHIPSYVSGGRVSIYENGQKLAGKTAQEYRDAAIASQNAEYEGLKNRWNQLIGGLV